MIKFTFHLITNCRFPGCATPTPTSFSSAGRVSYTRTDTNWWRQGKTTIFTISQIICTQKLFQAWPLDPQAPLRERERRREIRVPGIFKLWECCLQKSIFYTYYFYSGVYSAQNKSDVLAKSRRWVTYHCFCGKTYFQAYVSASTF